MFPHNQLIPLYKFDDIWEASAFVGVFSVKSDDFTGEDIVRLNQTEEQRNKNRRVKIIFSKN